MASISKISKLKSNLKYCLFVFSFCYGITFIVQCLLRLLWFIKREEHTDLAMFQMFFTIILLPIILVTTVYLLTKKFNKRKWFFLSAIIICSCIYFSAQLGFINWADSIGNRENPDTETLMIVAFEWQSGLIVTLIGLTICYLKLHKKNNEAIV